MSSRKYPRIPVDCPLSFSTQEPNGEVLTPSTGTACNLSWNGCAIHSQMQMDQGRYLHMSIALPGHANALNIGLAKVRWASRQSFGVEFLVLDSQEQARLRGFVTFRGETSQVSKLDYRA